MNYSFNPAVVRDRLVEQIRQLSQEQGFSKVVIGISGGKDSTVTAALCARALGKENVYGVMLPDGEQKDIADSDLVCHALGINHMAINIGYIHSHFKEAIDTCFFSFEDEKMHWIDFSKEADINVAPRLRMTVLRYITQALGARLAGTGNLSEIVVGYCTKDGDTSCDFSVLGALTSVEVVQVGLTMEEIPRELVLKTPADGLSGMSDEEKLGVSYEDIHHYIRKDQPVDPAVSEKIHSMHIKNFHKFIPPLRLYPFEEAEVN